MRLVTESVLYSRVYVGTVHTYLLVFVYPTRVLKKSGTRVQGVGYPGTRVYPTSRNLHKIKISDSNQINIYDYFEGTY